MLDPNKRHRFYLRLGKNRRDRKLAEFISEDRQRGVNISRLVKQLLYTYYTGTPMPGFQGQQKSEPDDEARQAALRAKLHKLSFDALKQV